MSTAEINIWEIKAGIDFRENIVVFDPTLPMIDNPDYDPECVEDEINNPKKIYQRKDLTGYTAKMDIRATNSQSGDLVKHLETGSGITIGLPDPVEGVIEFFIDDAETNTAPILDYVGKTVYFDLVLFPPVSSDDKEVPIGGSIKVTRTITEV